MWRDVYVCLAGYVPRKTNWVDARFNLAAVGLVVRGAGRYRVDGGPWHPIAPGTMLAVYPGHRFEYGPDTPWWEEHFVSLSGPALQTIYRNGLFPRTGVPRQLRSVGAMVERFTAIRRVWERNGPGDADRAVALVMELLVAAHWDTAPAVTPHDDPITAALEWCDGHVQEGVDFPALAERLGISYSLLRQRIKSRTGVAPARYLTLLRCNRARRLLEEAKPRLIKQISRDVGISDPYQFSRLFTQHVGVSPREYRRRARAHLAG
jgi:AraC-like DNA-binding protein